jgi:glycine/D-amino acid oxidase-like deaminating enzyme
VDSDDTTQRDLRSPRTPWMHSELARSQPIDQSFRCEVLVIGAGITGALVAQRLVRDGMNVVLIDREDPSQGSTMGSTAMLLWEIDRSLSELTDLYGFESAVQCYRASLYAVSGLIDLVTSNQVDCDLRQRLSIYLSADDSPKRVYDEFSLRKRAGLPGQYLDHSSLLSKFGIARPASILSPLVADADPVRLTNGLLGVARAGGARLLKGNAVQFESHNGTAYVTFEQEAEAEARAMSYWRRDTSCQISSVPKFNVQLPAGQSRLHLNLRNFGPKVL